MKLNVASILRRSAVNGPGERYVIWTQGCPLACPGCWNPDTWAFERRTLWTVGELLADIASADGIDGVTFTGGEPFTQAAAVAELAAGVKNLGLSVVVFTGYEMAELASAEARQLLALTDILVSGRFVGAERALDLRWRGSRNQSVHMLGHVPELDDEVVVPSCEIHLDSNGVVTLTGFPPDEFRPVPDGASWRNIVDADGEAHGENDPRTSPRVTRE